jgi:phospholipid/cholesterol/gamma-HCH transport system ATP-binding protein
MMSDSLLSLRGISVQFGTQPVLRNLHLNVPRGQTLVVIGESGCGKTVLLKLIVALLRPTEGEVHFESTNLNLLSERELIRLRLRVGYLFQGAALFDSLNVFDNIAFGLRSQKLPEDQIRTRVEDRLKEVGLTLPSLQKMPAELSGGMKKRVGLARALAIDPEVMLYDEPTTGLDPIMTDVINDLILQTRKNREITSIVVTHDLKTVFKVADRVVMLYPLSRLEAHEPQVIFDGSLDELRVCPDSRVREFLGSESRIVEQPELNRE